MCNDHDAVIELIWDMERNESRLLAPYEEIRYLHAKIDKMEAKVKQMEEALRFILDECDWEPSLGDYRIGIAAKKALEDK